MNVDQFKSGKANVRGYKKPSEVITGGRHVSRTYAHVWLYHPEWIDFCIKNHGLKISVKEFENYTGVKESDRPGIPNTIILEDDFFEKLKNIPELPHEFWWSNPFIRGYKKPDDFIQDGLHKGKRYVDVWRLFPKWIDFCRKEHGLIIDDEEFKNYKDS